MIRTLSIAALSAAAFTASASANDFTLGAGFIRIETDLVEFDAINANGAYYFSEFFGVEGELLTGISSEEVGATDLELNLGGAAFAKVRFPVAENFNLNARAGIAYVDVTARLGAVSASDTDQAWAYGVGGEYFFDGVNGVRLDVTRFEFDEGGEADAIGVAYVRRFGG